MSIYIIQFAFRPKRMVKARIPSTLYGEKTNLFIIMVKILIYFFDSASEKTAQVLLHVNLRIIDTMTTYFSFMIPEFSEYIQF